MFRERQMVDMKIENDAFALVGYDLSRHYAQISCYAPGMDAPETMPIIAGSEIYNIPLVLFKRKGVGQWFYGKEALRVSEEQEGILIDDLLEKACAGEAIAIENMTYEPTALLALFIVRSFAVLSNVNVTPDKIRRLMFTVDDLSERMVEMFTDVVSRLKLRYAEVSFQSYQESVYHFLMYQAEELRMQKVMVCNFDGIRTNLYLMERNTRTTPIVVLIRDNLEENMLLPEEPFDRDNPSESYLRLDQRFLEVAQREIGEEPVSCVYLLGDGFKEGWMNQSLRFLCQGRRVFQGNNLLSRGACYSLKDKVNPGEASKRHVYLGREKLISNIGIHVARGSESFYYALLDAGLNWFDATRSCELFLPEDATLDFEIMPLNGQEKHHQSVVLTDLPERPNGLTRVSLMLRMLSVNRVQVLVKDLGFGELFPGTDREWTFEFDVE